jgi:hypothetical protein
MTNVTLVIRGNSGSGQPTVSAAVSAPMSVPFAYGYTVVGVTVKLVNRSTTFNCTHAMFGQPVSTLTLVISIQLL